MAAFPDLIANDAMLAMTSGRASNMMRRTPIGQLTRSRIRLSSRRVRRVTFPTLTYKARRSHAPQWPDLTSKHSSCRWKYKRKSGTKVRDQTLQMTFPTVVQSFCLANSTKSQSLKRLLTVCGSSPGSPKSRTSRMPWSISSHFPFLPRSNLLSTL